MLLKLVSPANLPSTEAGLSRISNYFPVVQCPFLQLLWQHNNFSIHLSMILWTNKGSSGLLTQTKGKDNRGTLWHYTEVLYCLWWRVSHWPLLKSSSNCPLFCPVTWSTGSRKDGQDGLFLPSNLSKEKNLTDPRAFFLLPFLLLFTNFGYTFNVRKKNSVSVPPPIKWGATMEHPIYFIPWQFFGLVIFWKSRTRLSDWTELIKVSPSHGLTHMSLESPRKSCPSQAPASDLDP